MTVRNVPGDEEDKVEDPARDGQQQNEGDEGSDDESGNPSSDDDGSGSDD